MIVNRGKLLNSRPVWPMYETKQTSGGVSFGMSEAGYDIRIKQDVVLHPFKRFALASTIERFQLDKYLTGIVHDKSTWARRGLSVLNTVIEPGWKGYLTLELVYHGWGILRIPPGSGIAQVIFHEIMCPALYTGKYQDQPDRPVEAINSL